ncbi:MAG: GNAT family N-acetyltransferase [Pirellulaceae bacterium]
MDVAFRFACSSDCQSASDLVSRCTSKNIAPTLNTGALELLLQSMTPAETRKRLDDGWPHLMAEQNGVLVGVGVLRPPSHLYHLYVDAQCQHRGLGTQLFEKLEQIAVSRCQSTIITVNASLNAVDFYCRLGFVSRGSVVNFNGIRFQPMTR